MAKRAAYPNGASIDDVRAQLEGGVLVVRGRMVIGGTELATAMGTTTSVVWAAVLALRAEGRSVGIKFTPAENSEWTFTGIRLFKERKVAAAKQRGITLTSGAITDLSGFVDSSFAVELKKLRYLTPELIQDVIAWSASELVQRCDAGTYDFMRHPDLHEMDTFLSTHPKAVLAFLLRRKAKDGATLARFARVYGHARLMKEDLSDNVLRKIEGLTPWEDPAEATDAEFQKGMKRDLPEVTTVGQLSQVTDGFRGIRHLNMRADWFTEPLGSKRINAIVRGKSFRAHLVAITTLLDSVKALTKDGLGSHPIDQAGVVEACKELASLNELRRRAECQNEHGLENTLAAFTELLRSTVRMSDLNLQLGWTRRDVLRFMQPTGEPYPSLDVCTLACMLLGVSNGAWSNGCRTAADVYTWELERTKKPWKKTGQIIAAQREKCAALQQ
jgi:hypothetical protein